MKLKIYLRNIIFTVVRKFHRALSKHEVESLKIALTVVDDHFGGTRGLAISRALMNDFVAYCVKYIEDRPLRILEIGDNQYSARYFQKSENYILDFKANSEISIDRVNRKIVGDLTLASNIEGYFDIIISTCVLAFTKNPFKVVENYYKLLKPKGSLIGAEPFLSQVSEYDYNLYGEYFRFTNLGLQELLTQSFRSGGKVSTTPLGNRETTLMQLHGIVLEDFTDFNRTSEVKYATLFGYQAVK